MSEKCKNCKHKIVKVAESNLWYHEDNEIVSPTCRKIVHGIYWSRGYCNCTKPEPEKQAVQEK